MFLISPYTRFDYNSCLQEKGKMPDDRAECRNCGSLNKIKISTAEVIKFCTQCGMPLDWESPSQSSLANLPPPWLLASCQSCGHNFSRRESTCPKCNTVRLEESHTCKMQTPAKPGTSPKCDDTEPLLRAKKARQPINFEKSTLSKLADLDMQVKEELKVGSAEKKPSKKISLGDWALKLILWIGGAVCIGWILGLMLGYFHLS